MAMISVSFLEPNQASTGAFSLAHDFSLEGQTFYHDDRFPFLIIVSILSEASVVWATEGSKAE
jgi:hypothetical protein